MVKMLAKTSGWALISGTIFFVSAIVSGCSWYAALLASTVATVSKTPAYPLWEILFHKVLWRDRHESPRHNPSA